ncbi:transcriptional regulator [Vibrio phage D164]
MKVLKTDTLEINPLATLKDLGLNKVMLADLLGVSRNTVTNWGNNFPKYARQWLALQVVANNQLDQQREQLNAVIQEYKDANPSEFEYYEEINAICEGIYMDALADFRSEFDRMPEDSDEFWQYIGDNDHIHSAVDCHAWIIYYRWHPVIVACSNNVDAYQDLGCELSGDFTTVQQTVAFYAMYQDVQDQLSGMGILDPNDDHWYYGDSENE